MLEELETLIAHINIQLKKESARKAEKKYRAANKVKIKITKDVWKKNNKEKMAIYDRRKWLKRYYKMTLEEYDKLVFNQNGVCAICGKKSKKRMAVDHCHITNKIRGLLCLNCNTKLGWYDVFKDKIQEYLK